ncbi:MAG TPA: OmpA family protein, partial [Nitrospiria bacterium]
HTDSRPIGESLKKTFPSNWELSTARATNVIKYMVYAMKLDPARLQAVGYAQFRPIASNDTAAGRAKNRRIRMVVFKAAEGR